MPNIQLQLLILIISLWSVFWKAAALWRAAKYEQRIWFIALFVCLIVNSVGVLELIFLFKFAKKPLTIAEIKTWPKMLTRNKKAK